MPTVLASESAGPAFLAIAESKLKAASEGLQRGRVLPRSECKHRCCGRKVDEATLSCSRGNTGSHFAEFERWGEKKKRKREGEREREREIKDFF